MWKDNKISIDLENIYLIKAERVQPFAFMGCPTGFCSWEAHDAWTTPWELGLSQVLMGCPTNHGTGPQRNVVPR
jgi:hypothetical protein